MKTELFCILFVIVAVVCPSSAFADDADDLIDAAFRGDIVQLQSLLKKGVDVNAKGTNGETALWMAAGAGHTEIVEALLERGADVNVKDKAYGATALYMAAQEGHTNAVKVLLESKANVNIKREINGVTALMMAVQKGHTEIVKLLLAAGADVNAKANDGRAPLSIAKMMRHTEIIKLLKEYGAKDKEQKSLSHSGQSQFQSHPPNIQIDVQKEIARLHSDDPVEKEDAAFKLSCQPERAHFAIPHLIDLLDDETPVEVRGQAPFSSMADQYMVLKGTVRLAAEEALSRITGKRGSCAYWRQWWKEHEKELETAKMEEINTLVQQLREEGEKSVQAHISLVQVGSSAVPPLCRALDSIGGSLIETKEDAVLLFGIVTTLGKISEKNPETMEESIPCLLRAARKTNNKKDKTLIVSTISTLFGPPSVSYIMSFLESEMESPPKTDPGLTITQGLASIVLINMAEVDSEHVDPIIDGLQSCLKTAESKFKEIVVIQLANLAPDSRRVVQILEEELASETNPELRQQTQIALDFAKRKSK